MCSLCNKILILLLRLKLALIHVLFRVHWTLKPLEISTQESADFFYKTYQVDNAKSWKYLDFHGWFDWLYDLWCSDL